MNTKQRVRIHYHINDESYEIGTKTYTDVIVYVHNKRRNHPKTLLLWSEWILLRVMETQSNGFLFHLYSLKRKAMLGILSICLLKVNLQYEEVEISNLDDAKVLLSLYSLRKVCKNQHPCSLVDIKGKKRVDRRNVCKMMFLS